MDRHHKTKTDEAWEAIDFNAGMVAIDDKEANELGIPLSQRFPWDESKGIYLINGYHNLHCLVRLICSEIDPRRSCLLIDNVEMAVEITRKVSRRKGLRTHRLAWLSLP